MKIVATPMCSDVLKLAGVTDFETNIDPDSTDADIAVVLSETSTDMESVRIKLNTFSQIKKSVMILMDKFGGKCSLSELNVPDFDRENENIRVKVYSDFLRDIVDDMGFKVVDEGEIYNYLVYPDYLTDKLSDEIDKMGFQAVEVPSHKNTPKNPIKRAELRYKLLEKKICMKP